MLSTGDTLDGYTLLRLIGRGGFGEVWLCRSEAMGDWRALKFISATTPARLEKEYAALSRYRQAAAKIRSPHLTLIEHVGKSDGGFFYIMPLADGDGAASPENPEWRPRTLASCIQAQKNAVTWFDADEIVTLFSPVLLALQQLADAGLVHRDVKPENILFFDSHPALGDIGLLGDDSDALTRIGTPGYTTPSWYVGGTPDMYGAAATFYTLLTGNPPDKMGRAAFLWPPQGETSLPENARHRWHHWHAVIRRATEEKSAERFRSFRDFQKTFSDERKPTRFNRRHFLTLAAGITVAGLGGAGIHYFAKKPPSPPALATHFRAFTTQAVTCADAYLAALNLRQDAFAEQYLSLAACFQKLKKTADNPAVSSPEFLQIFFEIKNILTRMNDGHSAPDWVGKVVVPLDAQALVAWHKELPALREKLRQPLTANGDFLRPWKEVRDRMILGTSTQKGMTNVYRHSVAMNLQAESLQSDIGPKATRLKTCEERLPLILKEMESMQELDLVDDFPKLRGKIFSVTFALTSFTVGYSSENEALFQARSELKNITAAALAAAKTAEERVFFQWEVMPQLSRELARVDHAYEEYKTRVAETVTLVEAHIDLARVQIQHHQLPAEQKPLYARKEDERADAKPLTPEHIAELERLFKIITFLMDDFAAWTRPPEKIIPQNDAETNDPR